MFVLGVLNDFFEKGDLFDVVDGAHRSEAEEFLRKHADDVVRERVDGGNRDPVCLGSKEFEKALLNRNDPRFRKGGDEEILGFRVCFGEDVRRAASDDLGFSRTRAGNDDDRTVERFRSVALGGVEAREGFFEFWVGQGFCGEFQTNGSIPRKDGDSKKTARKIGRLGAARKRRDNALSELRKYGLPYEERVVVGERGGAVPAGIRVCGIVVGSDTASQGRFPTAIEQLGVYAGALAVDARIVPGTQAASVVIGNRSSDGYSVQVR